MKNQEEHESRLVELGMLMKNWRLSEGMTRDELHALSGVHKNSIRRAEAGENITLQSLMRIADGLGADIKDLFVEN